MSESVEQRLARVWHDLLPPFSDAERVLSLSDFHQKALLMLLHSTLTLTKEILNERNEICRDNSPPRKRRAVSPSLDPCSVQCVPRGNTEVIVSQPTVPVDEATANTVSLLECTQFSPISHQSPPRMLSKPAPLSSPVPVSNRNRHLSAEYETECDIWCGIAPGNVPAASVHEMSTSEHDENSADTTDYEVSPDVSALNRKNSGGHTHPGTGNIHPGTGNAHPDSDHAHPGTGHIHPVTGLAHPGTGHALSGSDHVHNQCDNMAQLIDQQKQPLNPNMLLDDTEYDVSAADWSIADSLTLKPVAPKLGSPTDRISQRSLTSSADIGSSAAGEWQRRQLFGSSTDDKPIAPIPVPVPISVAEDTQFDVTDSSVDKVIAATVSIISCLDSPSIVEASRLLSPRQCSSGLRQSVSPLKINLSPVRSHASPTLKLPSSMKSSSSESMKSPSATTDNTVKSSIKAASAGQSMTSCIDSVTSLSSVRHCMNTERVTRSCSTSAAQRTDSKTLDQVKEIHNGSVAPSSVNSGKSAADIKRLRHRWIQHREQGGGEGSAGSLEDTAHFTSLLRPSTSSADARKVCSSPVRKKEQRSKLPGWSCDLCEKWYADQEMSEEQRRRHMQQCSRHRDRHGPRRSTPPGFWDPVAFSEMDDQL